VASSLRPARCLHYPLRRGGLQARHLVNEKVDSDNPLRSAPESESAADSVPQPSKEKKRILSYLREHPEELRPIFPIQIAVVEFAHRKVRHYSEITTSSAQSPK
jgi:hypothetical protein